MDTEEYKSLYDYLNKPAGPELGRIVFLTAKQDRIYIKHKEISNPKFTGFVMMYPVSWLDQYFTKVKEINNN